jgi:hypothetical protein
MKKKSPHPAFGHLLPFFEREKALNDYRLRPSCAAEGEAGWEKVPNGRMRAPLPEVILC